MSVAQARKAWWSALNCRNETVTINLPPQHSVQGASVSLVALVQDFDNQPFLK